MLPEDLLRLFAHNSLRPGQDILVEDLFKTFSERKILLAHAPTGLGKTASALAVATKIALEQKKRVFFLTHRQTQHRIAISTLKLMKEKMGHSFLTVDLIGKRSMCNQEVAGLFGNDFIDYCRTIVEKGECEFYTNARGKRDLQPEAKLFMSKLAEQGPQQIEEVTQQCKEKRFCSYEISLALAQKATVIVCDYNYIFNPAIQQNFFTKLNFVLEDAILIIDEAHNLPTRIMEMMSSQLTINMLRNGIIEAKKFNYNGLIIWLQKLAGILTELGQFPFSDKEKLIAREEFIQKIELIIPYDRLLNELEIAADEVRKKQRRSSLGGIVRFLEDWQTQERGFSRFITEEKTFQGPMLSLHYTCLDPAFIARDIFQKIHTGVLMSGTLKPLFMYKDLLGIDRAVEKEYESPFPLENKLTLVVPETSTKFTLRDDDMYTKIAEKCQDMSGLIKGNVAIFFPSYAFRDNVCQYFKSTKQLFFEKSDLSKAEKEQLLLDFKLVKEMGGILLGVTGANFAEGIDFPGDLLNGVIIVGLPLAKPDLKTKEIIRYYEQEFGRGWDYGYTYPAMNKCLQSAGRCIRSETDKGVIIFLDERFAWQGYYSCLPKEGLIVSRDYRKLLAGFSQNL